MEIINVLLTPKTVDVNGKFRVAFSVIGAEAAGLEFPFANESLTEPLLQFVKPKSK